MLNLVSLSTQSLASCVNYFVWNCLTCFSNTKIGSVTSFSILFNFQGPVRLSLSGWRLDYFTTEAVFCQALFFEAFERSELGSLQSFSVLTGTFQRLLVLFKGFVLRFQKSFFCLSAWRSSIIPHLPPSVNTFRQVFSMFFVNHSGVRKSSSFECPPLRAGHLQRQLLLSLQPAQNGPFTRWAVMTGSRCGPVPDFPI